MPDDSRSTPELIVHRSASWLLGTLIALTIGGLGLGWVQMDRLHDRLTKLEQEQVSFARTNLGQLDALKISVQDLSVGIEQQGSLVNRVVGTVVPIKIPEGAEQELTRIEEVLADVDALLSSRGEAESLIDAFAHLVESLPPWVQAELFPRILPIRWQLDALWLLHGELPDSADDLEDRAADLLAHALNRPQGVPDELEELLVARADAAVQEATRRDEVLVIERVRDELRQNLVRQIEAFESDSTLFEHLEDFELKARLATSIHAATQDLKIAALASQLDDAELVARIDALASTARILLDGVRMEAYRQQQGLARNYQIWALEQIRAVPDLSKLQDKKLAEIDSPIDRRTPMGKDRTAALKEAQKELARILIERLAMIDTRLLDDAVGEWHRKVFSRHFGSLDEEHQLKVVQGFANSVKVAPEELP